MGRAYKKSRLVKQSNTKNLKYMTPLKPSTELHIQDVIEDSFITTDAEGNEQTVLNDSLLCVNEAGEAIKVQMREFNRMNIVGERYEAEGSGDEILMPSKITITGSENRKYTPEGGEEQDMYPVHSYNEHQAFLAKGSQMTFDQLVNSGTIEPNPFKPVQNYSAEVS
jgi:hypothetical protein